MSGNPVQMSRSRTMGHAPSTPSENEYGWPNGLNTNDGQTVTGCTPKDEMENTACTMMSVFGWSHPELIGDMEEDIKSKILELNAIYWSKVNQIKAKEEERKRELKKREIVDMLKWNDLRTATYTDGTVEHPGAPNECFTSDGTPVTIIRVAVLCGDETLEFDNISNPYGGIENPTQWVPAQEGNDGWRIGSARAQESAGEEKWQEEDQRQKEYNEFMHPEDPSRGTPLSVYDNIDDYSDEKM